MKLIIDIPEKWYRWAKFNDIENGSMVSKGILDAVANGTPLPNDAAEEFCKMLGKWLMAESEDKA